MDKINNYVIDPILHRISRILVVNGINLIIFLGLGAVFTYFSMEFFAQLCTVIKTIIEYIAIILIIIQANHLKKSLLKQESVLFFRDLILGVILTLLSLIVLMILLYILRNEVSEYWQHPCIGFSDGPPCTEYYTWFIASIPQIISGFINLGGLMCYIYAWYRFYSIIVRFYHQHAFLTEKVVKNFNILQISYILEIVVVFLNPANLLSIPLLILSVVSAFFMTILRILGFILSGHQLKSVIQITSDSNQPPLIHTESKYLDSYRPLSNQERQMHCTNCGSPYVEDQRFCIYCGKEIKKI